MLEAVKSRPRSSRTHEERSDEQAQQLGSKRCPRCSSLKPVADFGRNRSTSDGLQKHCRQCRAQLHDETFDDRKAKAQQLVAGTTKECRTCHEVKDLNEYYVSVSAKDGRLNQCKECVKERKRAEYREDPMPILERNRRATRRRRESGEGWTWHNLRRRYKMGKDEYQAILAEQGGCCAICRSPHSGARGFHVDHDHSCCPGEFTCGHCIRGLLCKSCNQLLGMAREDPTTLNAAIDYLKRTPIKRHVPGRHERANTGGGRPRVTRSVQGS